MQCNMCKQKSLNPPWFALLYITGPLGGESIGDQCLPPQTSKNANLWFDGIFLLAWFNLWANCRGAGEIRRHDAYVTSL